MRDEPRLLVLRADAHPKIGSGHIMRCLALAQEWQSQGGNTVFVGHITAASLSDRLMSEGFQVVTIDSPYPSQHDLQSFLPWLDEHQKSAGWIVLDGYHFDAAYHQALRSTGWPLLIIDDYAHLPAYHADIVTNPNAYGDSIHYQTEDQTLVLRGARFAMLRKEFRAAISQEHPHLGGQRHRSDSSRHILVSMGGADPANVTEKVIATLQSMGNCDIKTKIIIGPLNPHRHSIEARLRQTPIDAEILRPVTEMAPLMRWADIAISAAGSTCWELAALGVPMAVTILADNQEQVAATLADRGIAVNLGWHHEWLVESTARILTSLLDDSKKQQSMGGRGKQLIDGRGCERLAMAMAGYHFSLRPANESDCEIVFQWANDPLTRAASFSQASITWQEHCRWFAARLADRDHIFYLAVTPHGAPMAQARFILNKDNEAVISVNLAREFRGVGLGPRLIKMACKQLLADRPIATIKALIRPENTPSLATFAQAGFKKLGTVNVSGQPAVAMDYMEDIAA